MIFLRYIEMIEEDPCVKYSEMEANLNFDLKANKKILHWLGYNEF